MSRVRAAPAAVEDEEMREIGDIEYTDEPDDTPDAPVENESKWDAETRIIEKYQKRARSPLKAIRAFCVACMGGQVREIARCTSTKCVLYPFRAGNNPFQSRGYKP